MKVAAIQETKLKLGSKDPKVPGYTILRRDRPDGRDGGGLAFLVHSSVKFTPIDTSFNSDPHLELQAISATINGAPIEVYNAYCPPNSSRALPPAYQPDIDVIFDNVQGEALVLGDWNAHHEEWFSPSNDARGEVLEEAIAGSDFCILNLDTPTRLPTGGNNAQRPTSPDVSLVSAGLALAVTWTAEPRLTSDHMPLSISFNDDVPTLSPTRTYVNYRRAKWPEYRADLDARISALPQPTSCAAGEKLFRQAVLDAAGRHIPAGCRRNFVPGINGVAKQLEIDYNARRVADPHDPALPDMEHEIKRVRGVAARERWQDFVESLDRRSNPQRYWKVLQSYSGKGNKSAPPNQPIKFKNSYLTNSRSIAKHFNAMYTNIRIHKSSKKARRLDRKVKNKHNLDHNLSPFSSEDVADAIKSAKNSTALGPDGLSIIHLKHIGPLALAYLTSLFNLSFAFADIPAIWKMALVLPVPKPGKPPDACASYRPISLLCAASKILERLILPYLHEGLPLAETQHGFRKSHSPTSALFPLIHRIAQGFNERKPPQRTIAVTLDLSRAFETVNHDILREKLIDSELNSNVVRWLSSFLKGREQAVIYQGVQSAFKHVRRGVPQGAVLSPTLFNYYVSDFPLINAEHTSFADDFTIFASGPIDDVEETLNSDLALVSEWARNLELDISVAKSKVTLFSPFTHEFNYHPRVFLDGTQLLLDQHPKVLGVVLDPLFTFSPHLEAVGKKASARLKMFKALAGTSWGQDKETLLITFKLAIRSLFDFAAPTWVPNVKATPVANLQRVQNAGLRLATGSHRMASVEHLHAEAMMLPVEGHVQMLASQHLASALRPDHPSFDQVTAPQGPRDMKQLLQNACIDDVDPFLVDGSIPPGSYPAAKQSIHSAYVHRAIRNNANNNILGGRLPTVNKAEKSLPRHTRCVLSQLRSGHCAHLNSYLHRIGRVPSPTCPDCGAADHTVPHIFSCPSHPTRLSPRSLWTKPVEAATFLLTLPSFSDLPPLVPPRPPPPPEPPPLPPPPPLLPIPPLLPPSPPPSPPPPHLPSSPLLFSPTPHPFSALSSLSLSRFSSPPSPLPPLLHSPPPPPHTPTLLSSFSLSPTVTP